MSGSKNFEKAAWSVTAFMLIITILFMNGASLGITVKARTLGYETRLFDNSKVHSVDIVMDDWEELIENAADEEYYMANIVIDGEAYKNVGIRAKGNTSLSNVASMGSERYSLKVEFDHYDSTKTYYGLDKLCLNNLIQDSTMMKDYLVYTMMNKFGVASPLCSFVYITVNGNDWGLYLAVEGIEDGFLTRNYDSVGELYKPDSMSFGGGRGNGKDFNMDEVMGNFDFSEDFGKNMPNAQNKFDENGTDMPKNSDMNTDMQKVPSMNDKDDSQRGFDIGNMNFGLSLDEDTIRAAFKKFGIDESILDNVDFDNISVNTVMSLISSLDQSTLQNLMSELMGSMDMSNFDFGGMSMGSSDVKLQYVDDDFDSYSNIWNNAKTDITDSDKTRLINSLKQLSEYENIDSVVDIDSVLRYFVVHNYVCNGDSYTGSMIHNYYLYEKDGKLSMIPWDYNLAFGTFTGGQANSTINEPIDSPVSDPDDRPMWGWILSDEKYTELYHEYFSEFLETVDISEIIDNAYELIKGYVEKDPTKFYSYDEFETGVEVLREFCLLRSQSISMQIENKNTATSTTYVDASGINLSDMGSMSMGGGMGDMPGNLPNGTDGDVPSDMSGDIPSMPNMNGLNTGFELPDAGEKLGDNADTEVGGFPNFRDDSNNMSGDTQFDPKNFDGFELPDGMTFGNDIMSEDGMQNNKNTDGNSQEFSQKQNGRDMKSFDNFGGFDINSTNNMSSGNSTAWILVGVSVLILALGIVIAKIYR